MGGRNCRFRVRKMCPKLMNIGLNGVPMARLGLILGEDGAMASRKLFRYLPGPKTLSKNQTYIWNSRSTALGGRYVPPLLHEGTLGASRAGDAQSTLGVKNVSENGTPKVTSLDPQIGPKILPNRIKMSLKLSLRGGRRQV